MWHNRRVMNQRRPLGAALLVLTAALALPEAGRAQRLASAGLRVAARVAPSCSVITSASERDAFTTPSIRLRCGRSALRSIRVSTDSVEDVVGMPDPATRQWLSGGEVVFPLPTALVAVASRDIQASLPREAEPASFVVTLDF
jgi:hypothetical protein